MARKLSYSSTREAREPVIVSFEDGRTFELPGDVEADGFLAFVESYSEFLDGDTMPVSMIKPFFRVVMGEAEFSELRKQLTWREMMTLAKDLWPVYFGQDEEADEADGPLAST